MIPFNVPPFLGTEPDLIMQAVKNQKICGDGPFTKQCHQWLEEKTGSPKALLTTSCTHALEMAALLLHIQPGDEVILPSFTFCSTADAFVLRGAKLVFVDIRPDTMNIDETKIEEAEILREKGTNRSVFLRGQIDKYTWVDHGSSYLPSDMNAAYLWAQLQEAEKINNDRLASWNKYYEAFAELEEKGYVQRPIIPDECKHNAHMFYLKAKDLEERTALLSFLKENDILAVFHYIPLHSAPAGKRFGRFHGTDEVTTRESDRLLRLPMYYGLSDEDINKVIDTVIRFYHK